MICKLFAVITLHFLALLHCSYSQRQFDIKILPRRGTTINLFLSYRTRLSKRPRHLSGTDTSAWRHRAFSPCASFLFEKGRASGFKRTPCRQGFRHRVHNNTNTLCLLFPTRAACLSINDLEFWRGKGTKSVPEGCDVAHSSGTTRCLKRQFDIKSRFARHYKKHIFVISNSRYSQTFQLIVLWLNSKRRNSPLLLREP